MRNRNKLTTDTEIAGIAVIARRRRNRKTRNLPLMDADVTDQQRSPKSPTSRLIATLGRNAGKIARFSAVWHLTEWLLFVLKIPLVWRIVKETSSHRCSHVTQCRILFFPGFDCLQPRS